MQKIKQKTGKNRPAYIAPTIDVIHVQLENFLAVSHINPSITNQKVHYIDYDEVDMESSAGQDVLVL